MGYSFLLQHLLRMCLGWRTPKALLLNKFGSLLIFALWLSFGCYEIRSALRVTLPIWWSLTKEWLWVEVKREMWNSVYDLQVLRFFYISGCRVKHFRGTLLPSWCHGDVGFLFYCDGASRGNSGQTWYGFIGEWAHDAQVAKVMVQTDSKCVIQRFMRNKIPWCFIARWQRVHNKFEALHFKHAQREDFSRNCLAKRGVQLNRGHSNFVWFKTCA